MSHDLKALSRRWFDEVWNNGNEQTIDELLAADGIAGGLGEDGRPLVGPPGFRKFFHRMRGGFSDIHIHVDEVLAEGDASVVRFTFTARHSGNGLGVPATGKTVRATGMTIVHWRNGRIVNGHNEFDVAGLSAQLEGPPAVKVRV
jgi:steroid delta-isomerase-like uncharacterized protein